jgi:outer membrane protein assembly factor BamB
MARTPQAVVTPFRIVKLIGGMVCALALAGTPTAAQEMQDLFSREASQSVFVRDSAVAVEKFSLATRMEGLKEWDKAADVYHELLKNYPDRVVPWKLDSAKKVYQYISVTPAVQEQLSRWPAEGLSAYRSRFDGEAAAMLDAAGDDPAKLHGVFSLHFVTDAAKRAGLRLMDIYIERGEFSAAGWIGERMLDWHPSLDDERAAVLYRTALAYQLAGDGERAAKRLAELKEKAPQATATIAGQEVVLADSLATQLKQAARMTAGESSPDNWPMLFGSLDRSRVSSANNFGGARLFSIELPKPTLRNGAAQQRQDLERVNARDLGSGLMTGIFPVVDNGELFFQDNSRIYAVSLESGLPLPGWAATYDGDRNGRYTTNFWPTPRSQQSAVTVTDSKVLAVMGQPDLISMQYTGTYGLRDTRLVCLDRSSGKELWVARPRDLPEEAAGLRNLDLAGSPLVVNGAVFLQARGGKGMQFEDSYVVCFDLETGKFKFASYLASANATAQFYDASELGALFDQSVSHMAYAAGRIYALTNLGAVAAIDVYDGTIAWLDLYPRDVQETNRRLGVIRGGWGMARSITTSPSVRPWTNNPVMVSQGKVFVLPSDGTFVHIYDARSGEETARIALSMFGNADTILGVVGDKLILASRNQIFCVNWPTYDPKKNRDDNLFWASGPFQRQGAPDDSIRGRGFVTADSVIIPTAWQLYRISLDKGIITQAYPPGKSASWDDEEGPGNVLVTQDRMIIAGPANDGTMRVNVYTDLTLAMAKLDAAVAAAPEDVSLRLRYAEIMFVAGNLDSAVQRVDEAIAMINSGAARGVSRDRIFTTALTFAQKLAKENRPENAEAIAGLFDRAAVAATTPSQQVNYRLSRAALARQNNRAPQQMKLYQEILSAPELRNVPVADADGNTRAASDVARTAIDELIRRDATAYAEYERNATEMLQKASIGMDAEQLQEIAAAYPNAAAAPKALLAAAEIYETANNPRVATQVLRQAYFRYPTSADSPRILEAMARNYLKMPNRLEVAIARLNQAADLRTGASPKLSRPLTLPDGRQIANVSFAEAVDALAAFRGQAGAGFPRFDIVSREKVKPPPEPFSEKPDSAIAGVSKLIVPDNDPPRNDRVITYGAEAGVRVFAPGQQRPVMSSPAMTSPPLHASWVEQNLLLWNESELVFLAEDGRLLWRAPLSMMQKIDVVQSKPDAASPPPPVAQPNQPVAGGIIIDRGNARIFIAGDNQQMIILPNGAVQLLPNGAAAAAAPIEKPAQEQIRDVRVLVDRAIVGTTDGRIIAIALDGGKTLWQTQLGEHAANNLLATDDFVVARYLDTINSAQLVVYDTFTGQVISRRSFESEAGAPSVPINLALAPDGMLIYLLPTQIVGVDLFAPDALNKKETYKKTGDVQAAVDPEDLILSGDQMIITASDNRNAAVVKVYKIRSGAAVPFNLSDVVTRIEQNQNAGRFIIRASGPKIFVATPKQYLGYDMKHGTPWFGPEMIPISLRDMILGEDYVLVMSEPSSLRARRQPGAPTPALHLQLYSRAPIDNKESGRLDHEFSILEPSGIAGWQAVNGGLYYTDNQQRLHFLRGSANKAE